MSEPLFKIGDFQVLLWHLLLAVGFVLVLIVIIGVSVRISQILKARKRAQLEALEQHRRAAEAKKKADELAAQKQAKAAAAVSKPAPEPAPAPAPKQPEPPKEKKDGETKVYSVLYRAKDKHWLVQLGNGPRPLKLFETQEEAIAFAEDLIKHKDAQILVYRMDGQLHATLL